MGNASKYFSFMASVSLHKIAWFRQSAHIVPSQEGAQDNPPGNCSPDVFRLNSRAGSNSIWRCGPSYSVVPRSHLCLLHSRGCCVDPARWARVATAPKEESYRVMPHPLANGDLFCSPPGLSKRHAMGSSSYINQLHTRFSDHAEIPQLCVFVAN
jgi:hypothetical protein